jgi:general nucleoside transport system permease protein
MESILSFALLSQTIRTGVPYLLASLGGVLAERAGVFSITLEGFLLIGAFGATVGAHEAGPLVGLLFGVLLATLYAGFHALAVVRFKADAIISGVALNLVAFGLTRFLLKWLYDSSSNSPRIEDLGLPISVNESLGDFFGALLQPLVLLSLLLLLVAHLVLYKTPLGLQIRAAGEHPDAAETAGVSVNKTRWIAVLLSGALAGLGGAYLAFFQHGFTAGMSANRGYIALAAVILGQYRPLYVALACAFFAFAEALQVNLQAASLLPTQVVQMIPYLLVLLVLASASQKKDSV